MTKFTDEHNSIITISSVGSTQKKALFVLKNLAGKDLINLQTGINAQINSEQKGKIISNAALEKSESNGFNSKQHYAVAINIEETWKKASILVECPDNKGDINIKLIKRFESLIILDNELTIAYITVKESFQHGHRIYSLELQEIKKVRWEGGRPITHTTPANSDSVENEPYA